MSDEPYRIRYDRFRFPVRPRRADNTYGCRGCGGDLPPGKDRAWCGPPCKRLYHPTLVKSAVKRRDKGVCQLCGFDVKAARAEWFKQKAAAFSQERNYSAKCEFLHGGARSSPPREEYDHIIPMCEGGLTVVENMQTTCKACHLKKSKDHAAVRAAARRAAKQAQASDLSKDAGPELFTLPNP